MSDLTAFLAARLDEDEAAAKAVEDNSAPWDGQWQAHDGYLETRGGIVLAVGAGRSFGVTAVAPGVIEQAARHDPARVLREVEAGRAILARHYMISDDYVDGDGIERAAFICQECDNFGRSDNWPCPTLRAVAAIYRDHPDYDPGWAP